MKGKTTDLGVTNVRNVASPHWRSWLGPPNRCIIPFTSFSEYETESDGKKVPVWFSSARIGRSPASPASGRNWTSVRKSKEGEATADIFAFLTTEPNAIVASIHPKTVPVILTRDEDVDIWLRGPAAEAMRFKGRWRTAGSGS